MTNYSSLARREQVLLKLQLAEGGWVDGADLANERTGGSEGLKRLRELRSPDYGGHDIRKRAKPGSSQYQYRLVPPDAVIDRTTYAEQHHEPVPEPAETYEYKQPPKPRGGGHLGKTEDGKYVFVRDEPPPPTGQLEAFDDVTAVGEKFLSMPGALELGRTVPCPRCGGYRRAVRERDPVTNKQMKTGKIIGYEERSRDPHKPSEDCPRCNGFGVVPK